MPSEVALACEYVGCIAVTFARRWSSLIPGGVAPLVRSLIGSCGSWGIGGHRGFGVFQVVWVSILAYVRLADFLWVIGGFGRVVAWLGGVSRGFSGGVHGSMVFRKFRGVFPPGHNALSGVVANRVHLSSVVFVRFSGAEAPVVDLS